MSEFREAVTTADLETFCSLESPGKESPAVILGHAADAHWMLLNGGEVAARCSLWWSATPPYGGQRVGLIGHFAARGAGAEELLLHACAELAARGCAIVIGPMDGNTWRRYRVLTDRGPHPRFFLEPDNPDDWLAIFGSAGFSPLAEYYSARTASIPTENPRVASVWNRLLRQGFSIRPLNPANAEAELEALFELSLASFAGNFLYSPLAKEEFLVQYRAVMPYVRPELVLVAERDGCPAAFLFAVPDHLEGSRGVPPVSFIVKTLAVHPRFSGRGLGSVLLWQANRVAHSLGYRAAIHALMHQDNQSVRISSREGSVFRRYTLYSRALSGPA
jgi:GNAT superfamily N-acetyltransferase